MNKLIPLFRLGDLRRVAGMRLNFDSEQPSLLYKVEPPVCRLGDLSRVACMRFNFDSEQHSLLYKVEPPVCRLGDLRLS